MSDDLDFSSLSEGPVGLLAPADRVMARGAQRRRRQQVASAVAVLVLAVGGASAALARGGEPDALQYAPAPTPSCAPADCLPPEEVESVTPPDGALGEVTAGGGMPTDVLLDRGDATAVAGGTWTYSGRASDGFALLQPCPSADLAGRMSLLGDLSRGLLRVSEQVIDVDGDGRTLLEDLRTAVARCPSRPADSDRAGATAAHVVAAESTADTLVVEVRTKECADCKAVVQYDVVVVHGRYAAFVLLPASERDRALAWGSRARARLASSGRSPAERFPTEAQVVQGAKVWGVYLAVARDENDPKVAAAKADVESLGYHPSGGQIGCDQGAYEALGLPDEGYTTTAVYFATRELAQQFVDAYEHGVVGTALVTIYCAD